MATKKQPIKYFSTEVSASSSASQLLELLTTYGAKRVTIEWDGFFQPVSVEFQIEDPKHGLIPVRLAARTDDVIAVVQKKRGVRIDRAHASKIAWRHMKDLVEQQLLSVSLGLYTLTEAFFASVMLDSSSGHETLGQWMLATMEGGHLERGEKNGQLFLPNPERFG